MTEKGILKNRPFKPFTTTGAQTFDLRSNLTKRSRKICKRAIECFFLARLPNSSSSRATASFVGDCQPQSDYRDI